MKKITFLLKWKSLKMILFFSLFVLNIHSNNHLVAGTDFEYSFVNKMSSNERMICLWLISLDDIGGTGEKIEPLNEIKDELTGIKSEFIKNNIDEEIQELMNQKELPSKIKIAILLSLILGLGLNSYWIERFFN